MPRLINHNGTELTIEVKVNIAGSLLEAEAAIQDACNAVCCLATKEALKGFDTDGSSITTVSIKWTSKGRTEQKYETPYGVVRVERHVYQTSKGGKTSCPLEERARIIRKATPRFAMQLSHKYSRNDVRLCVVTLKRTIIEKSASRLYKISWIG